MMLTIRPDFNEGEQFVICDAPRTVHNYENEEQFQVYGHYDPAVCKENSNGSTGNTVGQ
jgi:hypothetical protein